MEKFSNWRDKGTGISPFMPVSAPSRGIFEKVALYSIKALLFLSRLPFVVLLVIGFYITSSKQLLKILLLIFFGLNNLDVLVDGFKRSNTARIEEFHPKINDVVIANYSSPIDGLIMAMFTKAPWRKIVFLVPNFKGQFLVHSVWSLFLNTFTIYPSAADPQGIDLNDYKGKVVFMLLEGTPSNNKALLPFVGLSTGYIPKDFTIKSLVLKVPAHLTLPIPNKTMFGYFFELASPLATTANSIKAKIYTFPSWDAKEVRNSFVLNGLNLVSLGIREKQEFYDYWKNYKVKTE